MKPPKRQEEFICLRMNKRRCLRGKAYRLKGFGITEISLKIFDVNDELSNITPGTVR
jgi:hypothetical protein